MTNIEPLKCMVLDDNLNDIAVMEPFIAKMPQLELVAKISDATAGQQRLLAGGIDLLFLDIDMPKLDGITLLRTLPNPPPVIFCTAFDHFARESYELEAIDYLQKPVDFNRFVKAIHYAIRRMGVQSRVPLPPLLPVKNDYLYITDENSTCVTRVRLLDIAYIRVDGNYTTFYLIQKKTLVVRKTLKYIIERLGDTDFIKIDRGCVVALEAIYRIHKNHLWVEGEEKALFIANAYIKVTYERFFENS
jgi:DNA-binding LytR/AlgR family response regulator